MGGFYSYLSGTRNSAETNRNVDEKPKKRKNDNEMIVEEETTNIPEKKIKIETEELKSWQYADRTIEEWIELMSEVYDIANNPEKTRKEQIPKDFYKLSMREAEQMRKKHAQASNRYERDPGSVQYNKNKKAMKEEISNRAKQVPYHNLDALVSAENDIRKRIQNDEELDGHYTRRFFETMEKSIMLTKSLRLERDLSNLEEKWNKAKSKKSEKYHERDFIEHSLNFSLNLSYKPPVKRTLMMSNITTNSHETIPVYCDKTIGQPLEVNDSLAYRYVERNIRSPDLKKLDKETEKEENVIKCKCHSQTPIVPCWQNPACKCYQVNLKLRKFQEEGNKQSSVNEEHFYGTTDFNTFDPIRLNPDHYYYAVGFACSELCGCKGRCTNNVTLLPEKKLNSFEVYQTDDGVGYRVRALNAIPAGTPIMEFVGEMVKFKKLRKFDMDYAFCILDDLDVLKDILPDMNKNWSKLLKSELEKNLAEMWSIRPKLEGNVARTFSHSCESNLDVVRVFQKGFSPSNMRFLVVTTEVIYPGVELTLNYGVGYFDELGKCLCSKMNCRSAEPIGCISSRSKKIIQGYYALRHFIQHQHYEKIISSLEKSETE